METQLRAKYKRGETVILDKGTSLESEVKVVFQTEGKLFTTVTADGYKWDVMTSRLSKKEDQ